VSSVRLEDGVWRLHHESRAVAIHGRDGQRDGDRAAAELLDANPDAQLVVIIGLGLGFALDGLERRGWPGTVVAIEPEPETVTALRARRDLDAWVKTGRLRLLVAPDFDGASDCWKLFGDGAAVPPTLTNAALAQLRPNEVRQAQALVSRMRADARSNHTARLAHAAPYLLHTLRNLPAIAAEADAAALDGAARGVPAILVAAGPSLDHAIPALRALQHQALIVSVDTASGALFHAGIAPHLIVAVDPAEQNARHLTDLPPSPDTWLVAEASVDPLAMQCFAGRTFLFSVSDHQPWPWLRSLGREAGRLRAWGSVLTTAFDLTLRMGCDPIAFVGADLAFTGNRPYARNVTYEHNWRRVAQLGVPMTRQWADAVELSARAMTVDISGHEVRSAPHLVAFRDWLVEQMRRESGRRFINATGAGILHGATVNVSPDDLMTQLPQQKVDLPGLIRRRYRPFTRGHAVLAAADALRQSASSASSDVIEHWEWFAPGLSRDRIVAALDTRTIVESPRAPSSDGADTPRSYVYADIEALTAIAQSLPLVPMRIAPHRMERAAGGARQFLFRTTAARIILCGLRSPDGAVCEDGQPLTRALDFGHVEPGSYVMWRDEVQFRARDDSDPRTNGRAYTVLVPACVEYLEYLPGDAVLRNHI
jgi:hypothetical protein